jgi:hypothetical protein
VLHEVVEAIEIEVGEDLTGEIADRQAAAGSGVKEAFVRREAVPRLACAADSAIGCGIVQDRLCA